MKMDNGIYQKYLDKSYEAYSSINTMVTNDNKRLLKEIYEPLTLVKTDAAGKKTKIRVDGMPSELSQGGQKVLIVDRAGMGKSTLVKRIFIDVYEKKTWIPLFVELRRVDKSQSLLSFILKMLELGNNDVKALQNDLHSGKFVIILDGFDEVQMEQREKMKTDIMDMVTNNPSNIFFITSRPDDDFGKFSSFDVYTIDPLKRRESYDLLRKHDKGMNISDSLIAKLKKQENASVLEYLETPLLVSLLFAAFNYKHTIPLKKHLFYEQVFDAFFERHDLTKDGGYVHEKKSQLDIYDFERVLRLLGLKCLTAQKVEFFSNELKTFVDESKMFLPDLTFQSDDYVSDLQHSVPMFCHEGPYLKWVHKSMQEFFAARFIYMDMKSDQDAMLTAVYNSKKLRTYYNMLDIYYDIDVYGFQKNIILPLLKEYVSFYESTYRHVDGIPDKLVKERVGLMFLRSSAIAYVSKADNPNDVFDSMAVWCKKNGMELMNMHLFQIGAYSFCTANGISPKHKLLDIIRQKHPELFTMVAIGHLSNLPEGMKLKDVKKIQSVADFSDTEELYQCCNYCLRHSTSMIDAYLDYDAVKSEIERIKATILLKENNSLLTSGV